MKYGLRPLSCTAGTRTDPISRSMRLSCVPRRRMSRTNDCMMNSGSMPFNIVSSTMNTTRVGLSLLKFADRVHEQADQIFVVPAGDVHPSRERVLVIHEAHDVQGDAPDGGDIPARSASGSAFDPRP